MAINREKLKLMTNEKLASIFACSSDNLVCEYCVYNNRCNRGTISCYDGILQWLKQKQGIEE